MSITLMILSLLACSSAKVIYPDQYEQMKNDSIQRFSTVRPNVYTTISRNWMSTVQRHVKHSASNPQVYQEENVTDEVPITATPSMPQLYTKSDVSPLQNWENHVNNIIVRGITKFALDVEREIHRIQAISASGQRENIVFSPISLAVTMGIVLAGSAGRTFDEVSKVLGLEAGVDVSRNSEIVHQMFGVLLNQLHQKMTGSPGPRVDFATAVFVQNEYPILPQFKSLSEDVYENKVIKVDFVNNGKGTQEMINAWVNQKTMGKITSILSSPPDPTTSLILLSALYFNGEWNQHFFNGATKRKPFFVEPNESIEVDMMFNGGQFPFFEDKQLGVKILGLPYKGEEISMYVMLPTAPGAEALRIFQNKLTVDIIENLIRKMKTETCIIGMPRMKLSSSLSLASTLSNLGLTSLFDPITADLSLISQGLNTGSVLSTATPLTTPTAYKQQSNENPVTPINRMQSYNLIFANRFGETNETSHVSRRNLYSYEDKQLGYTVEQWSTGYSIRKSRKPRDFKSKGQQQLLKPSETKSSYKVEAEPDADNVKVVNLEGNKYRFQEKAQVRNRRQSRPINPDFLNFVRRSNLPSFGLDELRNTANLVNPHLYASDVLHKVEIEITEKGTEAAAVTGVLLERDGNQKRLVANRPFLFFIRHNPNKLILFWGTLNTPTPNYSTVVK